MRWPCDPPVPLLGGIPQLLRSFDAYKRLIEIYPSDCNAIEFCQGTFSEMEGDDIYEMIVSCGTGLYFFRASRRLGEGLRR